MAINIKNAEVDGLIQKLRQLTGQGPTEIVKAALEREYRELRRQQRQKKLAEYLADIQSTARQKANDFEPDALYDKNGLPI
ncbi:MAG: type II toxin-antitoxin system VapB family antitoxin [Thermosynechococcaceae cyanobacterium]